MQRGNGIIDYAANAKRRKKVEEDPSLYHKIRLLYPGEMHVHPHGFSGPGTKLNKPALYVDGRPSGLLVRDFPAYDPIDECSRQHDLDYEEIFNSDLPTREKMRLIRAADLKALECYKQHREVKSFPYAYNGIKAKVALEKKLPSWMLRPVFGNYVGGSVDRELVEEQLWHRFLQNFVNRGWFRDILEASKDERMQWLFKVNPTYVVTPDEEIIDEYHECIYLRSYPNIGIAGDDLSAPIE
jgi:hypothetical protein